MVLLIQDKSLDLEEATSASSRLAWHNSGFSSLTYAPSPGVLTSLGSGR